ncbi:MAG: 50S ribosomal protein L30 [Nanoarchaeota archaeon]|nr:50S ribosomal protein L30 [Nanoarchaeota archaeon]
MGKIAIVLVRGKINTKQTIRDTFDMLRLQRKNTCVVVENNPITLGMIKKVKDFITWGEIDDATIHALIEKRGEEYKGPEKSSNGKIAYKKFFVHDGKKYKKYFRLNPPRKGFGRKGIKIPFKVGGALGYRKDKMVDLIQRMI